ncbi:hypothetical protein COB80_02920 [Candidatus Kaiserbacteria bacterium]|nr:MAG: hypothetical protein COB80_02920 [Candidatus Kaiserbacteria bacterium]
MDIYASAPSFPFAGIAFLVILTVFLIYSGVLIYHWFSLSMHTRAPIIATIIYGSFSALFIFLILISLLALRTV